MLTRMSIKVLLLLCFVTFPNAVKGETCFGIRREDSSYDFDLPNAVAVNMQNSACDAEWTIDQIFTAILDGDSTYFSHPFKKLTRYGISASYCPASVRFHVSCPKYTKDLSCSCTNSTDSNSIFSTILPSRETSSAMNIGALKRQHFCTIAVAALFVWIMVIL